MTKILLINGCVNHEKSRTLKLAKVVADKLLKKHEGAFLETLVLEEEAILPLNTQRLNQRQMQIDKGETDHEMFKYVHQFLQADYIIIAAPYWDLGFPAMVKNYIESVSIAGIAYHYDELGKVKGMSRAKQLYYVTTSGGYLNDLNLGYDTFKALSHLFGIGKTSCIAAEGLDIQGHQVDEILKTVIEKLSI